LSLVAAAVLGTLRIAVVQVVDWLAAKVAATVALKDIAVVWVVHKHSEMLLVLVETQRQLILVVAVAVIAAAMPVVNPVSQMAEALLGIQVAVVAQAGQHPTLCLLRTRKVSVTVTVCSPLLRHKTQQFPRQ
jgi:hypothetical protein